jgi:hypothetical protein
MLRFTASSSSLGATCSTSLMARQGREQRHRQHRQGDAQQDARVEIGDHYPVRRVLDRDRRREGDQQRHAEETADQPAARIQREQPRLHAPGMAANVHGHHHADQAQDAGPIGAESVFGIVASRQQSVGAVDDRIDAGQRHDGATEGLDQRLDVPVAVLEAAAAFGHQQSRQGQRAGGQYHVDQAVHAVEHDCLRLQEQAAEHAKRPDRHGDDDRELEQALFEPGVHAVILRMERAVAQYMMHGISLFRSQRPRPAE